MKKVQNYIELLLGLLLAAFSFNLFLAPFNLAAGGISGLALIIHNLFGINESLFILILNAILLLLSYFLLGKETTRKTILGSFLFPLCIELTNYIIPLIHLENIELLVIAILGGIGSGTGYGLVFKSGFTSGGTDILNQITEKYFHIPMATSILFIDGTITLIGGFVFGIPTMLYALLSLILISTFSNKKILGINENKNMFINTTKHQEVSAYFHEILKIPTTDLEMIKPYSKEKGWLILVVIKAKDYYRAKEAVLLIDSNAFITITNAYQIGNQRSS